MNDSDMQAMLIEYMGKGFLDNIIALFRQDGTLCRFIPAMLGEENMRVRLGTMALVEELADLHRHDLGAAVPGLVELSKHENPTIRGDAVMALGIIKDPVSQTALESCLRDSNQDVREAARDALAAIGSDGGSEQPESS